MIINGRPRHSQSQGLVEKGNHCVEMHADPSNETGMERHRKCSMDCLVAMHSMHVDCKTNAILTMYLHMQITLTHKCATP